MELIATGCDKCQKFTWTQMMKSSLRRKKHPRRAIKHAPPLSQEMSRSLELEGYFLEVSLHNSIIVMSLLKSLLFVTEKWARWISDVT